jgi:hypothetical protein
MKLARIDIRSDRLHGRDQLTQVMAVGFLELLIGGERTPLYE